MINPVKTLRRRLAGTWLVGVMDYYRHPEMRDSWGGPLNGQRHRQAIVETLIREVPLDAIVETGTYRGTTTSYFAGLASQPIYTVEFDKRLCGFGWAALRKLKHVHRAVGDSRVFLRNLAGDQSLCGRTILFYLDAHWNADLPVLQELEIIFANLPQSIVLIDDFQVIDDPGYGYDDYGSGNALVLDYIAPFRKEFGLSLFYPSLPAGQETGQKRGCITLVSGARLAQLLRNMSEIREYSG